MKIFTIILLFISTTLLGQNKEQLLRNGNRLYNDSNYIEAEIKYRKSLAKNQDYFNASFNLADAIYKQERYNESSALFSSLLDNTENKKYLSDIYHNLGNSLFNEEKFEKSIEAYKSSLRLNPHNEDTRYNLALAQQKQQQDQKDKQDKQDQKDNQDKQDKQDQKDKQDKQDQKDKQDKQDQKDQENKISKKDMNKMLDAMEQKEKEIQEKLQKKKVKGKKIKILKDW